MMKRMTPLSITRNPRFGSNGEVSQQCMKSINILSPQEKSKLKKSNGIQTIIRKCISYFSSSYLLLFSSTGIVERGRRETLVLHRLNPKRTSKRAPGPGAIRKRDWKPLADKFLKNRR
eukprot:331950-Karenia_brevis.AAC.1